MHAQKRDTSMQTDRYDARRVAMLAACVTEGIKGGRSINWSEKQPRRNRWINYSHAGIAHRAVSPRSFSPVPRKDININNFSLALILWSVEFFIGTIPPPHGAASEVSERMAPWLGFGAGSRCCANDLLADASHRGNRAGALSWFMVAQDSSEFAAHTEAQNGMI